MKKIVIAVSIIFIAVIGISILWNAGYIPLGLQVVEPAGCLYKADTEFDVVHCLGIDSDALENIEYEIYKTFVCSAEVFNDYNNHLQNDGYERHPEYERTISYDKYELKIRTYIKGLTVVVIAASDINDYTYVLYSTGSVMDYKKILDEITS